jgi:hypothetical protein
MHKQSEEAENPLTQQEGKEGTTKAYMPLDSFPDSE